MFPSREKEEMRCSPWLYIEGTSFFHCASEPLALGPEGLWSLNQASACLVPYRSVSEICLIRILSLVLNHHFFGFLGYHISLVHYDKQGFKFLLMDLRLPVFYLFALRSLSSILSTWHFQVHVHGQSTLHMTHGCHSWLLVDISQPLPLLGKCPFVLSL